MYTWDTPPTQPQSGNYLVNIRVKTYLHVWNMFNQDITAGTLFFNDKLAAGVQFTVANAHREVPL